MFRVGVPGANEEIHVGELLPALVSYLLGNGTLVSTYTIRYTSSLDCKASKPFAGEEGG